MRSLAAVDIPTRTGDTSDSSLHGVAQFVRANGSTISAAAQASAGIEGLILEWLPETQFTRDLNTVLGQIGEGFDNWLAQAPIDASIRSDLRDIAPVAMAGGVGLLHARGATRGLTTELRVAERAGVAQLVASE